MSPAKTISRRLARRRNKYGRRAITLLAITVTSVSIIGYVTLSLGINTLPSTPNPESLPFAAVIQPASESQVDQVSLQGRAAESHNGEVIYILSACGTHPYRAKLILRGLQRGSSASYAKEGIATGYVVPQIKTIEITYPLDLATTDEGLGEVQEIDVDFPHVAPCPSALQKQLIAGVAQPYELRVFGTLSSPWTQRTKLLWGLWQGPHASLTFPMVGDISTFGGDAAAPFTINSSPGKWTQPAQENVVVSLGTPPDWSMESAIPAPSTANTPLWSGRGGIGPTAQFTVPSQLATLQDWIVIFAVGLGIGGGLVASMLFEFLRPQPVEQPADASSSAKEQPPVPSPDVKPHASPRAKILVPLIPTAFLFGCILGRMRRRGDN